MIDFARLRRDLSPGSLGIVYVWGLMILAFSIYDPNLFPTMATVRVVLNSNVVSGIAALAVLLPMATGAINASVGGTISLTSVSCVYLLSNTTLPTLVVVGIHDRDRCRDRACQRLRRGHAQDPLDHRDARDVADL